jgi:hypothetical protein
MTKYLLLLITTLFCLSAFFASAQANKLPKELKGKWEGKIFVNNEGAEHTGNIVIGMGGLLAKSEYEIDFTISKFSSYNYFHSKYIEGAARYSTDDKGRTMVSFPYRMPIGIDYTTSIEGDYTLTRFETQDGNAYLYGTFTPYERDYKRIKTEIVLFTKEVSKKLSQNKELDNTIAAIVKEQNNTQGSGADRQNEGVTQISDKVLFRIDKATGWLKSKDGQWLEGKNKIQNMELSSKDIKKAETGVFKVGSDNFEWMEVRNVTVQGRQLIIVIKKLQSHGAREITSLEDNSFSSIAFAVFDKNRAIFNKAKNEYETSMFYWNHLEYSENYISDITAEINVVALKYPHVSKSKGTEKNLYLYFTTSDKDSNVGRFFLNTSGDIGIEHFFLPVPLRVGHFFNDSREKLKDFYFELPTENILPLVNLLK